MTREDLNEAVERLEASGIDRYANLERIIKAEVAGSIGILRADLDATTERVEKLEGKTLVDRVLAGVAGIAGGLVGHKVGL